MVEVTLGKTGIAVNKNGFGALPVQRIPKEDAVYLIKKAYEGGIMEPGTSAKQQKLPVRPESQTRGGR